MGHELQDKWRARQQPKRGGAAAAHAYAPLDEEAPPDQHEQLGTASVPSDRARAGGGGGEADENETQQGAASGGWCCATHSYNGNRMLRLLG